MAREQWRLTRLERAVTQRDKAAADVRRLVREAREAGFTLRDIGEAGSMSGENVRLITMRQET